MSDRSRKLPKQSISLVFVRIHALFKDEEKLNRKLRILIDERLAKLQPASDGLYFSHREIEADSV